MTFAEKLQFLRKTKGISQEGLAEMLSVSRQAVSKWEAQQSFPDTSKVIMLSQVFDVSLDELLRDDVSLSYMKQQNEESSAIDVVSPTPVSLPLEVVFCTKCGKENRASSKFCGYCGNPFTAFVSDQNMSSNMTKEDMDIAYYKADLLMKQQALNLREEELKIRKEELKEAKKISDQQKKQLRLQRLQYYSEAKCPRCGSTSLSGNKKGYGIGKGLIGASVVGPIGLVAGNIGSKKVIVTCMNCGYKYKR